MTFVYSEMFGRADVAPGESAVQASIMKLASSPTLRDELEAFARRFGCEHYSLDVVAAQLDRACKAAVATPSPRTLTGADGIRTAAIYYRERRFMWRTAVTLTGAMLDPREAYAAADIVIGMGSSALRGMAFGKPVVVVGERGFSEAFTPRTAGRFLHVGLYGQGDGDSGNLKLVGDIRALAEAPAALLALGEFGRRFVESHFALDRVAARLSSLYARAVAESPRRPAASLDPWRTAALYLRERRFLWRAPPAPPFDDVGAEADAAGGVGHTVGPSGVSP